MAGSELATLSRVRARLPRISPLVRRVPRCSQVINVTLPPHFSSLCKIATDQSQIFITIGPLEMHQEERLGELVDLPKAPRYGLGQRVTQKGLMADC